MNNTYKVVFNKARGVLMVANEITSSVQKKGTKTVVAAAVATAVALASGSVMAKTSDLESTVDQKVDANDWGGLAYVYEQTKTYDKINYSNNTIKAVASGNENVALYGAVGSIYKSHLTIKDSQFVGNHSTIEAIAKTAGTASNNTNTISGGVIMIKNGANHFVDTVFKDNTAESTVKGDIGALVAGGAIYQDAVINKQDGTKKSALVIEVSEGKDIAYTGNNVTSAAPDVYYGLYGTVSTSAGGFLFLDRKSSTEFRVGKDATLHIGDANSTGNMDSIASAIVIDNDKSNLTGFQKTGLGTLEINSSLDKFYGTVNVAEGTMAVTKAWTVMNELDVAEGATLTTGDMTLGNSPKSLTWNGKEYKEGDGKLITTYGQLTSSGTVTAKNVALNNKENTLTVQAGSFTLDNLSIKDGKVAVEGGTMDINGTVKNENGTFGMTGGVLKANGAVVFKDLGKETVALNEAVFEKTDLSGGSVDVKDFTGEYNLAMLDKLTQLMGGASVALRNGQLVDSEATLDKVVDAHANAAGEQVSAEVGADKKITVANGNDAKVSSILVEGDKANTAESLELQGGKFTLAGSDKAGTELVSGNLAEDFKVNVADGAELVLGFDADSKGQLSHTVSVAQNAEMTVEAGQFNIAHVEANGTVNVNNASTLVADKLTGNGTVLVGNEATAGKLSVKSLEGMTGTLFVDPAWKDDAALNVVGNASHLEIAQVGKDGLTASVVAGQNALVSFGATSESAAQAFESIASAQGLSWGKDNITAAAYVDGTLALGTGGLVVDGSLTAPQAATAGTVTVAKNGMFMLNQANTGKAVVDGAISLAEGSYLGVVNATEGAFDLATGTVTDVGATVVTDNPFIVGALDADSKKVTTSLDKESGLGALASTGIQAMTRHADFVMAETVADRTSIDQDLQPGMNLWATVRGERYESTEMDNGGTFRSDMGYGTFGADMALTDTITAGAALQYGKGSLRSDVSSIHNDIDNYGFTFYATKSFGPAKVVGELAYLQSKNDVTSSQTALNQEVDAKIYSAGVRAQYQLTTEHFQFVPSIGVRVSQLKTDAMDVGSVKVDDQEQTLVQLPIAMRINGYEQSASSGWMVAPSFKVAFVPTFGDKEITVLGHDQDVIDTTPVSADFGIRAKKGNVLLDANFIVGGGKDGTSSVGGKVGMKYVF